MTVETEKLRQRILDAVRSDPDLRALEQVLGKIQQAAQDPNTSASELAEIVQTDTVLTSKVLKVVNSAAFGITRSVRNLDEAIVILGNRQLRELCCGIGATICLNRANRCEQFDRESMWVHSFSTAITAKTLYQKLVGGQGADVYVGALLCNVGRVLLDQFFPEVLSRLYTLSAMNNISLTEAEKRGLGVTHADIAAWLVKAWRLDSGFVKAIQYHHGPAGRTDAEIINLAIVLAQTKNMGNPGDSHLPLLIDGVLKKYNLEEQRLIALLGEIDRNLELALPLIRDIVGFAPAKARVQ